MQLQSEQRATGERVFMNGGRACKDEKRADMARACETRRQRTYLASSTHTCIKGILAITSRRDDVRRASGRARTTGKWGTNKKSAVEAYIHRVEHTYMHEIYPHDNK